MVSPLLSAKWRTCFGMLAELPTFITDSLVLSNASPMPTRNVPLSTVRFSSVGCQWAGILVPSVHRMRRTKGVPSPPGSPETGASSQPFMMGAHFRSPKRTILCDSALSVFSWPKSRKPNNAAAHDSSAQVETTPVLFIGLLRPEQLGRKDIVIPARGQGSTTLPGRAHGFPRTPTPWRTRKQSEKKHYQHFE